MVQPSSSPTPLIASRSPWLRGPVRLPGDPGLSALALLLAGLARGESRLDNLSRSSETAVMLAALGRLGVPVERDEGPCSVRGLGGVLAPQAPIDLAGAGSGAGLLLGLLAAQDFETMFTHLDLTPGIESLLMFLAANGVKIGVADGGIAVRGPRFPVPLDLALGPGGEAIVLPLLLNAAMSIGTSSLKLPAGFRDPAVDLFGRFGAKLQTAPVERDLQLTLEGLPELGAQTLAIPGDARLAAFPAVAALIAPNSEVAIPDVALAPANLGPLEALMLMGANISYGVPVHGAAELTVRQGPLHGATIPAGLPLLPEDYPILTIAAAFAEGETLFEGLGEGARRLAITRALRDNGVDCIEQPHGLRVRGQPRVPGGGNIAARLDPRLAMAFLVLGLATDKPVSIEDGSVIDDLFPDFAGAFEHVGASLVPGRPA